ncbi:MULTISPECIES: aspartate aminotransferase family protein [Sorangium]|uniref:Polyketide synthase n=1 Tax=Sorangium cellulosum TaxID=56 RepID=A0A4V0NGQ3_SORCE|nr:MULTISPECIES: aminotransferase class III-fold pyridoxal phosphate-dependent enzyme [Sorangium]AUX33972.1 polyketide synthase [Sorangium cellulosum]WCQ93282.1 Glutamate-1-semialdehyde 2,1-aminomutase [Sorangium sp. Soce836]
MQKISLNENQKRYLARFIDEYTQRTRSSLKRREETWPALADARSSQGFFLRQPPGVREIWLATRKLRYPIVAERCEGAYTWDIDGNRYIDFCLGFGVHLFGHRPAFLDEALRRQLDRGMPIGFQSDRANDVAATIAAMTGAERVALCNTGAEAIMGAIRLARAATRRDMVAVFSQSYHGSYDAALPAIDAAHGLSSSQQKDTLVLEYGAPRSLEQIAEHADKIACVLVEPVQARSPATQPAEFLRQLRSLTRDKDIALIFDDILLGFRIHQGGSQAHFDIRADLATYGKILGGGMPIGAVAGAARFMDQVDGGRWSCDDDSWPAVDKVWFAGTFTKNPMTMAAAHAVVRRLDAEGNGLQEGLNQRTARLVERLSGWLTEQAMPVRVERCGSMFRFMLSPPMWILIPHLRMRGAYAFDGMTFFVSTAHSDADLERLEDAVKDSLLTMRAGGFVP